MLMNMKNILRSCNTARRYGVLYLVLSVIAFCTITPSSVVAQTRQQTANVDAQIEEAINAYSEGDIDKAISLLEEAEKKHPFHSANSEVLYLLASAYIDIGKYADADKTLAILMKRYGKYADALPRVDEAKVLQARSMTRQGKPDEALAHLKKFIDENPKSDAVDAAKFEIARAQIEKGDSEQAERMLKRIAADERNEQRDAAIMLLAESAAKKGNDAEAEKLMRGLFQTSADKNAKNTALFKLGEIYRQSGNLLKSIDAYRRIKVEGDDQAARELNAGILFEIAQTYENLNHPLEARIGFQGVYDFYAGTSLSTEAWHRAMLSDVDYGDLDRAENEYKEFMKTYPTALNVEDFRYYIGQKLSEEEKFEDAIRQFQLGLQEFPTGTFAESTFFELGVSQLGAKKFRDAEKTLQNFADKFPESTLVPRSFFYLGQAYLEQDRYEDAIKAFNQVAEKFPGTEEAKDAALRADESRLIYADYLANTGEYDKAAVQCRAVTDTDPELKEQALLRIGDIYLQAPDYTKAAAAFKDFIVAYPSSTYVPIARYSQGEALMQAGTYNEAETAFQTLLDSDLPKTNGLLPAAQLQIAFCRYFQDDAAGMSNALVAVVNGFPTQPEAGEALYWLGYLHRSQRAYMAAAKTYSTLVDTYPRHDFAPESAYLIGECYVLDNKAPYAPAYFINAFSNYPNSAYSARALTRVGEIYIQRHELDGWLLRLDELSKNIPEGAEVCAIAHAAALMRAKRTNDAEQVMNTVSIDSLSLPLQGYALAIQAGIQNLKGAYEDAINTGTLAADICLETQVGLDEALFQLAQAYEAAEMYTEAEATYAQLLSETVIPNNDVNAEALVSHAFTLLKLEQPDNVVTLCDEAAKLRPSHEVAARGLLLKGDAETMLGNDSRAAQYYKRATILYGRLPTYGSQAYQKLIDVYTRLGMTEDAAEARTTFNELYPDNSQ